MAPKIFILLCHWGGSIYNGNEGVAYDKPPGKAIKVQRGIKFNEFIKQIYVATSIDKQRYHMKVICRYPSFVGKDMKYIPLPITDDDDIEILFHTISLNQQIGNIDIYLELEENELQGIEENELQEISQRVLVEERSNDFLTSNIISYMVQNENFNTISQIAVINNDLSSGFESDNEVNMDDNEDVNHTGNINNLGAEENTQDREDDRDENRGDDGQGTHSNSQLPSCFANIESVDTAIVNNWMLSHSESENDLTRELGKNSFKDKEELIRVIKLYTIRKHKQYEVVETCPTVWKVRCKLYLQSGCKWQLRACKRKNSGLFEITKYVGPHTCLHSKITQDHPQLDASLISQEIQHLVKEQPSISIPALRAQIIEKFGYTPSYMKVWAGKQQAIEHIFGNWDDSYNVLPKFLEALKHYNPGTIVEWCKIALELLLSVWVRITTELLLQFGSSLVHCIVSCFATNWMVTCLAIVFLLLLVWVISNLMLVVWV